MVALGSFDFVGERRDNGSVEREVEIQFHRLETRLVERRGELEMGTALTAGLERSGLSDEFNVSAYRLGSKLWLSTPIRKASLRAGADMLATSGRIQNPLADDSGELQDMLASRNPVYQSATGRNVIGAYTELRLPLGARLELDGGLRGDVWLTGSDVQQALEPRGVLRWFASDRLTLHVAGGLRLSTGRVLDSAPRRRGRGPRPRSAAFHSDRSWALPWSYPVVPHRKQAVRSLLQQHAVHRCARRRRRGLRDLTEVPVRSEFARTAAQRTARLVRREGRWALAAVSSRVWQASG